MQDIDIGHLRKISELIYEKYNYDFRNYALSSFRRRVARVMEVKKLTVGNLLRKLEDTPPFAGEFVDALTVNVTEMFRDPTFWKALRDEVLPSIREKKQKFKIWHAGCSSGEEVMSMCVLLKELGILEDVSITGTDLDLSMLERAKSATFPMKNIELNEKNYLQCGGGGALKHYYTQREKAAVFDPALFAGVSFKQHDLVLGGIFDKFDLILCRNVMIYFNESLQNDVLRKFHESLFMHGFLAIGSRESLIWCEQANCFSPVNADEKIYRKIKA